MPNQSRPAGAVFLSYASQDAEAAACICTALRTANVEVWFDQSELRGGDAWDAQIKKHIQECALFIPLISAHTNARTEGYFRREWKLATRRLLDIADDATFLLPVVIDDTREADARVPEEFLRAHWTRLPGGETPPAFAHRVRQLLVGDGAPARNAPTTVSGEIEPSDQRELSVRPRLERRHRPWLVVFGSAVAIIVSVTGWLWWSTANEVPSAPDGQDVKSIAVLPFSDLSPDQDQEYFSDGMSEELLNLLVKIPKLRVTSRSSAFSFKGQNLSMPEIAKRLNVAHILDGSVRKSGNQVRITAQLIDANSDSYLWSETYDRTLDDIFLVQDEIAGAVVKALQVKLLGTGIATNSKPQDPEAYNLALQGRYFLDRGDFERSIVYFQQSLERDSGYAPAWAGLSRAYAYQTIGTLVPLEEAYRRARDAAEKALLLDPQLVDAHLAMGWIHLTYDWNWAAAESTSRTALALEPGNGQALLQFGTLAMILGRWDEAIEATNQAIERDPLRPSCYTSLGLIFMAVNRDAEAESALRKALELAPDAASGHLAIGRQLLLQGDAEAALREIQQEKNQFWRLSGLPLVYHALGQHHESDAALAAFKSKYGASGAYAVAGVHAYRGEANLAFEWLELAYDQRDGGLTDIKGDRMFRKLVDDPRYRVFLRKMKLPE